MPRGRVPSPQVAARYQKFAVDTGLSTGTARKYKYSGPKEMDLYLTPYVLSHAKKDDCRHCLIALALEIAINKPDQHIMPVIDAVSMRWTEEDTRYIMRTPANAARLIEEFDKGHPITPQILHVTGEVWQLTPGSRASMRRYNQAHLPERAAYDRARRARKATGGPINTGNGYGHITGDRLVKQRYIDRGLEAPNVQS